MFDLLHCDSRQAKRA